MNDIPDLAPPPTPERLIIGQVVAPFGVKGEIKVSILSEFPDRFSNLHEVVLAPFSSIKPEQIPAGALNPSTARSAAPAPGRQNSLAARRAFRPPSQPATFQIESAHAHKGQILLKLGGINDPESAATLRGYWLMVPLEQARKLPRGSYYLYQIVGLDVVAVGGETIGKVTDVLATAANDVYVVRGPGVQDPSGELLVPAIRAVVKRIEPKRGRMLIVSPKEWA